MHAGTSKQDRFLIGQGELDKRLMYEAFSWHNVPYLGTDSRHFIVLYGGKRLHY